MVDHKLTHHYLWPQQGFFLPYLVVKEHSWAIWSLLALADPLYDLWPKHCTSLQSGVLPTKFGSHRAFLNNLTPCWPLYDLWPQKCSTVMGSFYQIWWPLGIPKSNLTSGWSFTFGGVALKICSQTLWVRPLPPYQVSAPYLKARRNA